MLIYAAVLLIIVAILATVFGKRYARKLQRTEKIRIDRFKLKRRHAAIELEVFGSREVVDAIRNYAKQHHVSIEEASKQAKVYLAEIVPKFNLLAYYRFGAPIARAIMHFLYRPVVERNADYVLVAHMLFKFISLSYAVGEWARVWPLNHLFKWFGGYFVRRRYREPLYHAVLANFVKTITRNGVTQGIFIEGGLTRDGAFLKPKLGMLDYIVTAKRDPEFDAPLYLIPTAVNYDRVLEDRNLSEELMGKEDRSTRVEKLRTTFDFLFRNTFRSLFKRFKRYGYAVVTFGEPVSVDKFITEHPDVLSLDYETRKPAMQLLADTVMTEISNAVPVTPVTLVARIFGEHDGAMTEAEMLAAIGEYRERWRERVWLLREKTPEDIWRAARAVLTLRHLLVESDGKWSWPADERMLRDFYAASLMTYAEVKARGWPERQPKPVRSAGTQPALQQ
jgi:glycerol-3-phosphate O-acyltransferase